MKNNGDLERRFFIRGSKGSKPFVVHYVTLFASFVSFMLGALLVALVTQIILVFFIISPFQFSQLCLHEKQRITTCIFTLPKLCQGNQKNLARENFLGKMNFSVVDIQRLHVKNAVKQIV